MPTEATLRIETIQLATETDTLEGEEGPVEFYTAGYRVVARVDMQDVQAQFTIFLKKDRLKEKRKKRETREKWIEEIEQEARCRVQEFCRNVGASLAPAEPR